MKRLVVVESPTKARTIRNFLAKGEYQVEACMGHVRDLPSSASEVPAAIKKESWGTLGVNVDEGYQPVYVIPKEKRKVVKELKDALKNADELYIATDEDREGESIGWHLLEVLKPKVPVRRMVFHEITKEAIQHALTDTREIDQRLVDAQETRRVLDRLVGYTISPLLWKKIAPRLSAGRVQSVAVRVLVQRERERLDFVSAGYWDLKATLEQAKQEFEATLVALGEQKLATGRDFDENTGKLKEGSDAFVLEEAQAKDLADRLPSEPWRVASVESKVITRRPAPPFITSTMQQEANRKLGLSARDSMRVAQKLYEQGHITYMRTDSPNLSSEAIGASRRAVEERYGAKYLSPKPRQFSAKKSSGAQEAHEAIRPAGTQMRTKSEIGLSGVEGKLYDLIWKRTVATQMADAKLRQTRAEITAGEAGPEQATFRANGQTVEFPGFFRAYVEGSDDPNAALEDRDNPLPELNEGDTPDCHGVEALGHETKPPARYTDATLVRMLESEGVGRPSTYASIIDTIVNRGYVRRDGKQLAPTFTAFATNNLLEHNFEQLVDTGFTAEMEQILDDIASGDKEPVRFLERFFRGDSGIEPRVEAGLEGIDAREMSTIEHPKWGPFRVRVGKFGPYVEGELDGETKTASLPEALAPADADEASLRDLLRTSNKPDEILGIHPEFDQPVLVKQGPYGPYVQLGDDDQEGKPKRTSLPKGVKAEDVDLPLALGLLSLPRTLGEHPDGGVVKSSIGRYGPYVQHGSLFASLKAEDDVLKVKLDRAVELLAQKRQKNKPLRTLGAHPETGDPIEVFEGRYGPYVKHKRTNATIPKGTEPDDVTLEQAVELLAEKAGKKGGKKGGRRKKTA
ncbi:MAG: type I DNA topoisomerase [Rhodothermales bacterium]